MRRLLIAAALLVAALPFGADAQQSKALAPDRLYTVTLTSQDLAYVGSILRKQPYEDVAQLLARLQAQVEAENAVSKKPIEDQKKP